MNSTYRFSSGLLILLGLLTALDVMALDFYLPAFPSMQRYLNTDSASIQRTLSIFMIGLAIGQAIIGSLSDMLGRRRPLLAGVMLFIISSLIIALTSDIKVVMVARAFQGFGAAAGLVVPRAIVSDVYTGHEAARAYAFLMQVLVIMPFIAPPLGGILLKFWGWQIIFWIMTTFAIIAFAFTLKLIPETKPAKERLALNISSLILPYFELLRYPKYMFLAMSGGFVYSSLFAYIGGSAFVYLEYFNLTPFAYSLVFASIALGMLIVGQINLMMLRKVDAEKLLICGLVLHTSLAGIYCIYIFSGFNNIYIMSVLLLTCVASLSLVFGNIMTFVMDSTPSRVKGTGSAFLGVLQYTMGGFAITVLSLMYDGTLRPLPIVLLVSGLLAVLCWIIGNKLKAKER